MTKNPDTPPHLLSINFLSTGKLMKHSTEWLPYGILRHCQTKNFDRKSWYFLPPPNSSHPKIFSIPEIGETLGGSPPKFFGTVRQKIFDGKSWYPLLSINFLATGKLMEHSTERFPYGILRHCQTKFLTENRDTPSLFPPPPLSSKNFFDTWN